jgi:hypothetical protein
MVGKMPSLVDSLTELHRLSFSYFRTGDGMQLNQGGNMSTLHYRPRKPNAKSSRIKKRIHVPTDDRTDFEDSRASKKSATRKLCCPGAQVSNPNDAGLPNKRSSTVPKGFAFRLVFGANRCLVSTHLW